MWKKLDIGCGGSNKFMKSKFRGDVNCDILKPAHKIMNFVLCDAHYLPFRSGFFEKIFLFEVLEHVNSPVKVLQEAQRVLGHGILELTTPNALYLPKIVRSAFKGRYSPDVSHIQTWGLPELENLFSTVFNNKCNFLIEYQTCYDEREPAHYRILRRLCPFPALKSRQLHVIIKV